MKLFFLFLKFNQIKQMFNLLKDRNLILHLLLKQQRKSFYLQTTNGKYSMSKLYQRKILLVMYNFLLLVIVFNAHININKLLLY